VITNRQGTWQRVGVSILALGFAFSSMVGVASAKTQVNTSLTKIEKFALLQAQVQEYKAPWWQMNSSTTFAASLGLTKYAKIKTEYTGLLNQLVQQVGQSQVEYMTVHKGLVKGEPGISILDRQINVVSGKSSTQIASKFGLGKMAYEDQGVGWKVIAGGVNGLIPTNDFHGLPFQLTSMVGEHVVQAGSAFSVRGSVSQKDIGLMAKMLVKEIGTGGSPAVTRDIMKSLTVQVMVEIAPVNHVYEVRSAYFGLGFAFPFRDALASLGGSTLPAAMLRSIGVFRFAASVSEHFTYNKQSIVTPKGLPGASGSGSGSGSVTGGVYGKGN